MEFYIIGAVAFAMGLGIKALGLRCGWIRGKAARRKTWEVVFITAAVCIYVLNIVVYLALVFLMQAIGLSDTIAYWGGWFLTLGLVVALCGTLGWIMEQAGPALPRFTHPFADDEAHPFGTDVPKSEFDFHAEDKRGSD
jgi:hypothetical protein